MDYASILAKVMPIIFLFSLGILFKRSNFLETSTIGDIKKLILNISLPALLFLSFSQTEFQSNHLIIVTVVFSICLLLLIIGFGLRKILHIKSLFYPLLLTGFEAGMMGYSIFTILFGAENVFKFAIVDLGQVTFVFFVMVAILVRYRDGGNTTFGRLISSFIGTPVIIAIFLGIIVQKTGLINVLNNTPLAQSLLETLSLIGAVTTPLICVVIGYELQLEKSAIGKAVKVIAVRIPILIIFALIVNRFIIEDLLHLDKTFQAAVMVMFLLPPPFVLPLYIKSDDKENRIFVLNTLSIHTIVTVLLIMLLGGLYLS